MTHLPESSAVPFAASSESSTKYKVQVLLSHSAATACISTATSRGVLGPLSGDDSCKPLVQFKGWLECNKTVLKADQDERHTLRNKYTQQHFSAEVLERGRHGLCQSSVTLPGQTP
jgi:hypothetical protein